MLADGVVFDEDSGGTMDGEEFLALAPAVPVRTKVEPFPLEQANEALTRLRSGQLRGAAVLVLEDVHWADDATLDAITVLGRRIGSLPALNHQPEFAAHCVGGDAEKALLDVGRAALLVSSTFGLTQRVRAPTDSGLVRFELAGTIPIWRQTPEDELPRVIILRSEREAQFPSEFHFFSNEAPANLRPRLEISYVPRVDFTLP